MYCDGREYLGIGEWGHELCFRYDIEQHKYVFRTLRKGTIKRLIGRVLGIKEMPVLKP